MIEAFEDFERRVAAIQAKHGARIERAVRMTGPRANAEEPFEVHVVSFPDRAGLAAYRADPATLALADLRGRIFSRTSILEGVPIEGY